MANYAVDSLQDGCYPGTAVLINTLNIRNQADLDAVESTIVPAKAALWETMLQPKVLTLNIIVRFIAFCLKIYTNGRVSSHRRYCKERHAVLPCCANLKAQRKAIFARLEKQRFLVGLDRAHFISAIVDFYERTNELHPFREGNGRTACFSFAACPPCGICH